MGRRFYQAVRTLVEANRSPAMKALDLRGSADLLCVNMMCDKVGEACICRLSRQGLTLVPFSVQLERFSWYRGCA